MASSMKDIKLRIHSVESTMQITKAMELVASSKLRRAQEQITKSRPYFETLYTTLNKIAASSEDLSSVYTQTHEVKRVCWIVIAGDRGLAGGYNNNVMKLAMTDAKDNVDDIVDNARGSGILGVLVAILIAAAIIIAIIVMVSKNNGKYNRK